MSFFSSTGSRGGRGASEEDENGMGDLSTGPPGLDDKGEGGDEGGSTLRDSDLEQMTQLEASSSIDLRRPCQGYVPWELPCGNFLMAYPFGQHEPEAGTWPGARSTVHNAPSRKRRRHW